MRYEVVIRKFDYLPSGIWSPAKYNSYVIVHVDETDEEKLDDAIKLEVSRQERIPLEGFKLMSYAER